MLQKCTDVVNTSIRLDSGAQMCTLDRLLTSNLMCWDVEKTTVPEDCQSHCEVCQKSTRVHAE